MLHLQSCSKNIFRRSICLFFITFHFNAQSNYTRLNTPAHQHTTYKADIFISDSDYHQIFGSQNDKFTPYP